MHDDIEAKLSDFHDGTLSVSERAEVERHLAGCAECREAYEDLKRTMAALSGIKGKKEGAPPEMADRVTETIHRRSAGRFFGRKTLGDRVPFGVLLIVALIVLGATAAILWSSTTGSVRSRPPHEREPVGSGHVVPTP